MTDIPDERSTEEAQAQLREFVGGIVALRKAFVEQHGEKLLLLDQWIQEVNKRFSEWIEENRPALQELVAGLARVLEKLPEWEENLQANMLLVEKGLAVLRSEGFTSTGFVFSIHDIRDFGAASPEETNEKLLQMTQSDEFPRDLLHLYESSGLRPDRAPLLEEALTLHRDGRFAGAVTLLYSQLEGIVTDALVAIGGAVQQGEHGVSAEGHALRGLHPKLKRIEGRVDSTRVFSELLQGVLSSDDESTTVSRTRNYVLHGGDTSFATAQRSTQIVLWVFAVLIELRAVLPVEARSE